MGAFRQIQNSAAGGAAPFENHRALSRGGALHGLRVEGDHRGGRHTQHPFDLGAGVMLPVVVTVENQRQPRRVDADVFLEAA